jgi:hypothetical protein
VFIGQLHVFSHQKLAEASCESQEKLLIVISRDIILAGGETMKVTF